jgi:hypothetical protein
VLEVEVAEPLATPNQFHVKFPLVGLPGEMLTVALALFPLTFTFKLAVQLVMEETLTMVHVLGLLLQPVEKAVTQTVYKPEGVRVKMALGMGVEREPEEGPVHVQT